LQYFSRKQYGFRTESATEKAVCKLTNEILMAVNNSFITGGVFCYVEKTFDCVHHKILS
jgi:hypothetical protein